MILSQALSHPSYTSQLSLQDLQDVRAVHSSSQGDAFRKPEQAVGWAE
jgi:hypothetical protein